MANALGLGPSAARLAGSSPALRTNKKGEYTPYCGVYSPFLLHIIVLSVFSVSFHGVSRKKCLSFFGDL